VNVLSIDTATEVLALAAERDDAWAALAVRRGLQHSPSLLPLAERLLRETGMTPADLALIVCSTGPGSFTGIRIGLATALGISQARAIPVVGVSTLDAMARMHDACDRDVFAVIDARKGKIYAACYRNGARQGDYMDITPADLATRLASARGPLLVGPDAARIRGMLGAACAAVAVSEANDPRMLLLLGKEKYESEGAPRTVIQPLYLRKSEAEIVSGR
jgi:tRNA threonylcarbamoyladenosine biosynthesis protein TsaB